MHSIWQVRLKTLFPFRYSEDALQAMYKKKPNLESIKVLCCSIFVRVEKSFGGKIDRTSQKRMYFGVFRQ